MFLNNVDFKDFIVNILLVDKYLEVWVLDVDDEVYYKFHNGSFVKSDITFNDTVNNIHPDDRKDYMESVNQILNGSMKNITRRYRICRENNNTYNLCMLNFLLYGNAPGKRYLLSSLRNMTAEAADSRTVDLYNRKNKLLNEYFDFMELEYYPDTHTFNCFGGLHKFDIHNRPISFAYTILCGKDADRFRKAVAKADAYTDDKLEMNFEIRFPGSTSSNFVSLAMVPVYSIDGKVVSYSGKAKDVTKQELEHQRVKRMAMNMLQLDSKYKISLWQFDRKTSLFSSEQIDDSCHDSTDTFTIRRLLEDVHPDYRRDSIRRIRQMLNGTLSSYTYVTYINFFGDKYSFYKVVPEPISGIDGEVERYAFILQDITEKKENQFKINKYATHTHLINKFFGITLWGYKPGTQKVSSEDPFIDDTYKLLSVSSIIDRARPDSQQIIGDMFRKMDSCSIENFSFISHEHSSDDNRYHTYRIEGIPMKNEYDEILEYGIMKSDISEKLELIRKNEDSHRLLVEILESLPAIAFIKDIDDDFRFVVANAMFIRFFAPGRKSVVGMRLDDFASPDIVELARKSDKQALAHNNENPLKCIEKFPNANGGYSYLQCYKFSSSVFGRNLLICAALDVTELLEAKKKAEESDRLKSSFLANISHEIRTPLNAIVGFSDLLINTADAQEKNQYSQIIKKNNEQLLMLVNDVLDLSKLESGTVRFSKERFEMGSICDDIYVLYNPKFQNKSVKFILQRPEKLIFVNQDIIRVREVILNLISNAEKYTSSGYVKLGYRDQDSGVYVYVEDTGAGISAENQKKVFNRFEKLDSLVPGTGLGLCICKSITEAMHGRIGVESQPGKGSTFWFWIPKY